MKNEKGFAQAKEVWDERFRREGFLFGEEPNQYLVSQAATLTKRRALLVADGEEDLGAGLEHGAAPQWVECQ